MNTVGLNINRDVIMQILREVDAVGVSSRSQRRFNRRIYTNKVSTAFFYCNNYVLIFVRDPILCGTLMGMTN